MVLSAAHRHNWGTAEQGFWAGGRLGLPQRVDARRPRWLVATVTATSILRAAVGLSVVALLLGEQFVARLRMRQDITPNTVSPSMRRAILWVC